MRFSLGLPTDRVDAVDEFVTGAAVREMAEAAEAAGYDALHVTDHPAPDDRWLAGGGHHALDPMVALGFAAAATRSVRLHTHVFVAPYRNPLLAAKSVLSLDVLSGGRVILGVAAGYLRPEFRALGVDFEERNALLDESLDVMRRVWTESGVAYEGRHFTARGVTMLPRPVARPHPVVWVGGNSDAAMRRAVEQADGWSPFPNPPEAATFVKTPAITSIDDLATRLAAARDHATAIGRTAPLDVCFAPFAAHDDPRDYEALGVNWLTVRFDAARTRREWLDLMHDYAQRTIRRH
jgi:probable F420-dependent oxidoreductase